MSMSVAKQTAIMHSSGMRVARKFMMSGGSSDETREVLYPAHFSRHILYFQ